MHPRIAAATTLRVMQQLRRDPRTVALMLVVPCVLVALMKWVFDGQPETFDRIGVPMLGIFPFVSMFLVTSIAMLRERTSGTLERLMTMPLAKLDILAGYGGAFALLALVQGTIVSLVAFRLLDLHCAGKTWHVIVLAVANALLGMALGLFVSAFASTEFQAVQFMPAFVLPQFLLCGLLVPRDNMATALTWISDVLPLTYAYDALARVAAGAGSADGSAPTCWSHSAPRWWRWRSVRRPCAGARPERRRTYHDRWMRRRTLVPLVVACAAVAGVLAYGLTHQGDASPGLSGIDPRFHRYAAPALPDRTLQGQPFSLSKLRGKPVVVNFWGSWCAPCRREVPQLVEVAHQFAGKVSFVGVDVGDSTAKALKFARTHGIRYPLVPDPDYTYALDYRAGGTPWTFIVDRSGTVVDQLFGQTTAAALSKKLDDLLSA